MTTEIQTIKAQTNLIKAETQLEKEARKKKPESKLGKLLNSKVASKEILKKSAQITVEVHQKPLGLHKMDRDKSRFFDAEYEEEKKNLFF